MRPPLFCICLYLYCGLAFAADPPVWTQPSSGVTVGSFAYFDCKTPATFTGTAAYMKLWVGGTAKALNHGSNRLGAVVPMSAGTYAAVCQYSIDGVNGIDSVALTITYGDGSKEKLNLENSDWTEIAGCNDATCGPVAGHTDVTDTGSNTWNGSGTSRKFPGTWDGTFKFEDEDWYQKRLESVSLPAVWIYDFWIRQSRLPRAVEFGISQCDGNHTKYRMAFQAEYATSNVWNVFSPVASDPGGSAGTWVSTGLTAPPPFTNPATDPNNGFSHVYFVGHPAFSGSSPVVVIDAIQIGAASGTSPGNAARTVNSLQVFAYTATTSNCTAGTGPWNLQSAQFDLDSTHNGDNMWLDQVSLHFQP
jgi:hypothetical protein